MGARPDAILFDLLTALLDSWSLWDDVAGGPDDGRAWRMAYLRRMYDTGAYVPYEDVLAAATADAGLPARLAADLLQRWDELEPWPEAPEVLRALPQPLGVVTNCSQALGARAAARLGVDLHAVVTAEDAGHYKPDPRTYGLAVQRMGVPADRILFVAGSAGDVPGATGAGLRVIWHDRVGMPPVPGAPEVPRIADLRDLPALIER